LRGKPLVLSLISLPLKGPWKATQVFVYLKKEKKRKKRKKRKNGKKGGVG